MQTTVENVFPKVQAIVADVLAIDEGDIQLNSRLIGDLGAESIDFLDFIFQLEREFKIKIPRGQLEKKARGSLEASEFEVGGYLTEKGVEALQAFLSEIPADAFPKKMKANEIPMLFTVETFCKLVVGALAEQPTA
jgi:acyl carrier protein